MPYDVQAWLADPFRSHAYVDEAQPARSALSTNTDGDLNLQSPTESLVPPPLTCRRFSEPYMMGIDLLGTGAVARISQQG